MQAVDASVVGMWAQVLDRRGVPGPHPLRRKDGHRRRATAASFSPTPRRCRARWCTRSRNAAARAGASGRSTSRASVAAVKLFLELVFTGGTIAADVTAADALAALELAHRWQVVGVVGMLERALVPLIDLATFSEIAETAATPLKGLPLLSSSCVKYAQNKNAVIDELAEKPDATLSPVVLNLIGKRMSHRRTRREDVALLVLSAEREDGAFPVIVDQYSSTHTQSRPPRCACLKQTNRRSLVGLAASRARTHGDRVHQVLARRSRRRGGGRSGGGSGGCTRTSA